jgi:hypothetical protein
MKTLILIVLLLCVGSIGLAQQNDQDSQSGAIYFYETVDGYWVAEGYPPVIDPWAACNIKPVFLMPLDGSGPIALDPTLCTTVNPNFLINIDKVDPMPLPHLQVTYIDPDFINVLDKVDPIIPDHRLCKQIDPAHLIVHE